MFTERHKIWSKGLTKESDSRLAYISKRVRETPRWNKGLTKETDLRVASSALKMQDRPTWNKGLTKETDLRVLKNTLLAQASHQTPISRIKKSEALRKFYSTEKGKQNRQALSNRIGERNPAWKNGITYDIYPREFNKELKELIRCRDNYTCQICGIPECELYRKLSIHHIDYKKRNCLPSNLTSLCPLCNSKVNHNRRVWENHFNKKGSYQHPLRLPLKQEKQS